MKSFFKSLLASILGCSIVLGGLFLISLIVMGALMSFDLDEKYVVEKKSVLYLNLSGTLSDRVEKNPFLELLGGQSENKQSLVDILNAIDIAKSDDKIEGIYIQGGSFIASSASMKEIRDALIEFKESEKFIIAYGDVYTQGCYYLASVADEVILNPEGMLDIHGYSSQPMFYKGLMDKLGVEMQIFKVGTFKSAVEPYMNTKMSDANKEQVNSYMTDMWKTLSAGIAESRGISVEKINEITESFPFFKESKFLVDNKLVDKLMYETEVHQMIKNKMSVVGDDKVTLASPANIVSAYPKGDQSNKDNLIAILYAEGSITSGSGTDGITDKRYVKEIEKIRKNKNIKAVVFRVNSPGGSAFASEQIWKAIEDLKLEKPIVVSMGDVAASGGYYISCNANKIFAQPNTITGSIGIFGMFPNVEGLTNKVGLSFDNAKTHKFADFGDITRPMREDEKALMQNYVERGYDLFLKRCAEGRGVTSDSINAIGQGRVWSGNQALAIGLVDEIGGIDDAIAEAVKLAGFDKDNYAIASYPKPVDMIQSLFAKKKQDIAIEVVQDYLGVDHKTLKLMKEIKEQDYLQARLPYEFNIQ